MRQTGWQCPLPARSRSCFNTTFNVLAADDPATLPHAVHYWLADGVLYRQVEDGPADPIVKNVVNESEGVDLFQYYYYNGSGDLVHSTGDTNLPTNTRRIKAVKVAILVDLRPGHSPEYMKIVNLVQLRNQRNF